MVSRLSDVAHGPLFIITVFCRILSSHKKGRLYIYSLRTGTCFRTCFVTCFSTRSKYVGVIWRTTPCKVALTLSNQRLVRRIHSCSTTRSYGPKVWIKHWFWNGDFGFHNIILMLSSFSQHCRLNCHNFSFILEDIIMIRCEDSNTHEGSVCHLRRVWCTYTKQKWLNRTKKGVTDKNKEQIWTPKKSK